MAISARLSSKPSAMSAGESYVAERRKSMYGMSARLAMAGIVIS